MCPLCFFGLPSTSSFLPFPLSLLPSPFYFPLDVAENSHISWKEYFVRVCWATNSRSCCICRVNYRQRNYAEVSTQLHGAVGVVEEFAKYRSIPQIKQLMDRLVRLWWWEESCDLLHFQVELTPVRLGPADSGGFREGLLGQRDTSE